MLRVLFLSSIWVLSLLVSCSDNDTNNNPIVPIDTDTSGTGNSKLMTSAMYPNLLMPINEANTYIYNRIIGTDTVKYTFTVSNNNGNGYSLNAANIWLGAVIFKPVDDVSKVTMHTLKFVESGTIPDTANVIAELSDKAAYVTSQISKIYDGEFLTQNGVKYKTTKIVYTSGVSEFHYYFVQGKGLIRYSQFTNNVLSTSFEMASSIIK